MRARGQIPFSRGLGSEMGLRLTGAVLLAAIVVLLIAAAEADGGTYVVRECHNSPPQNRVHEAEVERLPNPGAYSVSAGANVCGRASESFALKMTAGRTALHGQFGLVRFVAPAGATFLGVEVDAKLRRADGHKARLLMADGAGVPRVQFANGVGEATTFLTYPWSGNGVGRKQFVAMLICDRPGGTCPSSDQAKAFIRDVVLTVRDDAAPTVQLGGDLLKGGWVRGSSSLEIEARDLGSGVRGVFAVVNDTTITGDLSLPCDLIPSTADAARLTPCQTSAASTEFLDTGGPPFTDGANDLVSCAFDYGANPNVTCDQRVVRVDNEAPELAFRNRQNPGDPELIRAPVGDRTSGLDAASGHLSFRATGSAEWLDLPTNLSDGELRTRVDSGALAPGSYEFRAEIADVAGNRTETTSRANGQPMRLEFPLKEPVRLEAELGNGGDDQVVAYRTEGEVRGRLLTPDGAPLRGERVTVVQRFAEGSLLDRRTTTTATDARGRYEAVLPGGPSRNVDVFYAGSRRFQADAETGLDFDVRGKASLRVSKRRIKAGQSVTFRGRVKRHFARIPRGGKLVEVQVRTGGGWTTLQEATGTDRKGAVTIRHRFRGFYTRPVTFVFRLKATRENGWPYRGAAKSKRRRVTVLPK